MCLFCMNAHSVCVHVLLVHVELELVTAVQLFCCNQIIDTIISITAQCDPS